MPSLRKHRHLRRQFEGSIVTFDLTLVSAMGAFIRGTGCHKRLRMAARCRIQPGRPRELYSTTAPIMGKRKG